eukprot:TRINITY_DN22975_c0_g1_i1.p1 TRINITY_DN22975_c0_g1~~TRINITY_DN22975_c0_g1_i1.p1  ORF type:complete len:468 (+),score=-79.64 TRINITY_DN22975_c0_g1_i1:512-1915(+)
MFPGFITAKCAEVSQTIPIKVISTEGFESWLAAQPAFVLNWFKSTGFSPEAGNFLCVPSATGSLDAVVLVVKAEEDFWAAGALPQALPAGNYRLEGAVPLSTFDFCLAWGLGGQQGAQFTSVEKKAQAKLLLPEGVEEKQLTQWVEALQAGREWINLPANIMTPAFLEEEAQKIADRYAAECQVAQAETLKTEYPAIYAVGQGAEVEPRLIEILWGNPSHPRVTLVGKGVCFDSGGLDLKPASGMRLMKKDMSGAAHALVLAKMIMAQELPIRLHVLIPAVENAVDSRSYRPGDIVKTRAGLQVEIHNTDAEGRMILCDALAAAVEKQHHHLDLLIDFATLTGAASIALGPDLPAFYTNQAALHKALLPFSTRCHDPVWPMPLHKPYADYLKSDIADCANASSVGLGGSITAALFLSKFVPETVPWMHFDLHAWNLEARPGRPKGGEIFVVRGLFAYLQATFQNNNV